MHLPAILGAWGAPPDKPAWAALAVGAAAIVAAFVPVGARAQTRGGIVERASVPLMALGAALLTLGYVDFYLRGGPRIIDATSYFLQARAIAEGHFAWHVPEPTASFRGRFLLAHGGADDVEVAGIFPPGYPLLLSLGFAVGAPFIVGLGLAAGLVVATYALARELAREAGMAAAAQENVGRIGAALSVVCAALRYHTADTMAHGACALAFAAALLAALRARRRDDELPWFFLVAGGALGFVVSARFASALALGGVLAWLAYGARASKTALVACAIAALPGVLLLLIAQSAATGHPFGTAQGAYYAASDGPAGCFRYGFGAGIGCLVEHGDFVRARATGGYGLVSALGVTARRLRMHLEDVANFEPLALLVLLPFTRAAGPRGTRLGARASGALVLALILAYAPFYFDGDYPGGGARFFADALPVEHALIALGLGMLARRTWAAGVTIGLACAGFAVHAAYDHEQLRTRDGGHPMFDREILVDRGIGAKPKDGSATPAALVFVETDHGFDLAHDPDTTDRAALAIAAGAAAAKPTGTIVARLRGDDHDRLLYERLGRPPAWVYKLVPDTDRAVTQMEIAHHETASGTLEAWSPPAVRREALDTWRFEAEAEWPPLAQQGGAWAEPIWVSDTCASPSGSGRALALHTSGAGSITIALPVPHAGAWKIAPRLLVDERSGGVAIDVLAPDGALVTSWKPADAPPVRVAAGARTCVDLPARTVSRPDDRELRVVLSPISSGPDDAAHPIALDRIQLAPGSR